MKDRNIAAIALFAGLSRRMGENKLLKSFDGEKFYRRTVNIMNSIKFWKKIAVTRYPEIEKFCKSSGINVVLNTHSEEGIASSVRLGVKAAQGADGFIFLTGDQPLLRTATVLKLVDAFLKSDKIIVPRCAGQNYNPCIFPKRYEKSLLGIKGDAGGKQVYKKHQDDILFFEAESDYEFKDMDSKEDCKSINEYLLKT